MTSQAAPASACVLPRRWTPEGQQPCLVRTSCRPQYFWLSLQLSLAMRAYRAMILAAVLVIASVGRLGSPGLEDADQVFLRVGQSELSALIRGVAVAAVFAVVALASSGTAMLAGCRLGTPEAAR